MGVALGAQVGHVVTYLCSPEGSLIYTVFTKKCQKRTKRGTPYFYRFWGNLAGTLNASPLVWALGGRKGPMGAIPMGLFALRAEISRWGVQSARKVIKIVYFRGGHT